VRNVHLSIIPEEENWQEIHLTDEVVAAYNLNEWAQSFSLMTAGYRDQLDPSDASNPSVPFNLLTMAILGEARARALKLGLSAGVAPQLHVGGETRPHTQDFIKILSRVYAANGITVHLRAEINTTPIWYSSYGIFYNEFDGGDNLTASHSPYYKGGWKPMDSAGKQLLHEEKLIIAEVQRIVKDRGILRLAPWSSPLIRIDFNVDEPYAQYLASVINKDSIDEIQRAAANGFCCAACPVGGSMKATTERLFRLIGIPTGDKGIIKYFYGEEDSHYHGIGMADTGDVGPDPGKSQVYRNIGAQQILLEGKASVVFIWDPDGDRFNLVTLASHVDAPRAKDLGLEVESFPGSDSCIVYFTPNQIYLMLTAYRLNLLKTSGVLHNHDWFVTRSITTSHSIDEIASLEGIPVASVRVGFKYLGTLSEWVEQRLDPKVPWHTPSGEEVLLGQEPRALIMCEESGGAVLGGAEQMISRTGKNKILALREKDGLQLGLASLSLAADLYNSNRSFAQYYSHLIENNNIRNRYFVRRDLRLYDESLTGEERERVKDEGMALKNKVVEFFQSLTKQDSFEKIQKQLNDKVAPGCTPFPIPTKVCFVGDGTLLEFGLFWCTIRASGTDALLRYYIEGHEKNEVQSFLDSLISLHI
jgi:phosphomannomutase